MNFIGFVKNMKGVEKETVIHISIQFWKEPWPYGMDNEETEIRFKGIKESSELNMRGHNCPFQEEHH